jgi:hypothetical protein
MPIQHITTGDIRLRLGVRNMAHLSDTELRIIVQYEGRDRMVATYGVNLFGSRLDGFYSYYGCISFFGVAIWMCGHKHIEVSEARHCASDKIASL